MVERSPEIHNTSIVLHTPNCIKHKSGNRGEAKYNNAPNLELIRKRR